MDEKRAGEQPEQVKNATRRNLWRPLVLLGAILFLAVLARLLGWGERLGDLRQWIYSFGAWGYAVFILIYVLATVAVLPGSVLTVIAGAIFGTVAGVIVVSIASVLGASLAFLISRYFARDAVSRWLSGNEKFNRLDEMTERHGAVIVAIVRLIPLFPFDVVNYGFGLTRVPFPTYVFWSWLCMLPGTVLYVTGADVFAQGTAAGEVPWALVFLLAGVAVLLVLLIHHARKVLQKKEKNWGEKA